MRCDAVDIYRVTDGGHSEQWASWTAIGIHEGAFTPSREG
jgi:hypothetical protein